MRSAPEKGRPRLFDESYHVLVVLSYQIDSMATSTLASTARVDEQNLQLRWLPELERHQLAGATDYSKSLWLITRTGSLYVAETAHRAEFVAADLLNIIVVEKPINRPTVPDEFLGLAFLSSRTYANFSELRRATDITERSLSQQLAKWQRRGWIKSFRLSGKPVTLYDITPAGRDKLRDNPDSTARAFNWLEQRARRQT